MKRFSFRIHLDVERACIRLDYALPGINIIDRLLLRCRYAYTDVLKYLCTAKARAAF